MIYTVTLNPSIDYVISLEHLQLGALNRIEQDDKFPGGKGINVSRVLKRLGVESETLGFIGGFTGAYIEQYLATEQIATDFVHVEEDTRINVKVTTDVETEINGQGPMITTSEYEQLQGKIRNLPQGSILILSGSVPAALPETTYEELIKICVANGVKFVVDAEGDLLQKAIAYRPFLIKPNHHELGGLFNCEITEPAEAIPYARQLVEQGAQNVIVSFAGKGAVFVNAKSALISSVPVGELESSVGAGDSLVAGFLAHYLQENDVEAAFKYGVAAGSATAFSVGLATKKTIEQLLPQVTIIERSEFL
ncbi:1-phosphofructokinase [Sporosarcina sp. NPDC096371]|uniref:1-phosphofructokinase n=1 Tax=Sporosarcina sp. NPDC096371 TaxID=3364530 RepID=UPI00380AC7D5